MAVNIKLKRSSVPGNVPTVSQLELGEIALNTYDGKAFFKIQTGISQSIVEIASTGSTVASASYAAYATSAGTASFSYTATTASYSLNTTSASYAATATSASYALNTTSASYAQQATSASYALNTTSASYAETSSYASNFNVSGNLVVGGDITATTLHVQTVTSSVIYSSGSNILGDATNDTQTLIGTVNISGSLNVTGSVTLNNLTGSLYGTASWAIDAINTLTASVAPNYTLTSSFQNFTQSYYSASASFDTRATNNSASISYLSSSYLVASASFDTRAANNSSSISYLSSSYLVSSASFDTRSTNNSSSISYLSSSYIASSASFDYRINLISGSFVTTASFNVFTASYYNDSASFNTKAFNNSSSISSLSSSFLAVSGAYSTRLVALELFSSSLDATFATDADLNALSSSYIAFTASMNAFSASILNYTSSTNASIAALNAQTASLLAKTASLNAFTSSINSFTQSYYTTSGSVSTRLVALELFSSSLDDIYATDAQLNYSASILSASIAVLSGSYLNSSASFNTRITNNSSSIANLSSSFSAFSGSYNTGSFTGSFRGVFTGSLDNLRGTPTHIPFFSSSQVLADSVMYQVSASSIAINENAVTTAAPEALYVFQPSTSSYNVITGKGNLNNYLQLNIQNTNTGTSASSDVVATANNGNESSFYIDMGINGQNYIDQITNGPGNANDAYLYSVANDMYVGNYVDGKNLYLFNGVNGDNSPILTLAANKNVYISSSLYVTGSVNVGGGTLYLDPSSNRFTIAGAGLDLYSSTGTVQVVNNNFNVPNGGITANYVTASLYGTASWAVSSSNATTASYAANATSASYASNATSASYAATASYANNFTVAGTLTAQTIIAQVITSSVEFVTGSTHFGSIISNTHQFTGSVSVSGSLAVNGSNVILTNQTSSMSVLSASYASGSTSASYANNATTASYALASTSASYTQQATTSSYALNATSASFATTAASGTGSFTGSFVGSLLGTASRADNATSASYAANTTSASYANNATTASYALVATSASFATTAASGTGSFTGSFNGTHTGSLLGTSSRADNATSASYAATATSASYAQQATTASYANNATSASYAQQATTASYALNATSASFASTGLGTFSGSFSGSFFGNGAGLTNISASSVVGLNLSQIASGSVTASVDPAYGFKVNSNTTITGSTQITGSLGVTGSVNITGSGTVLSANVDTIVFTGSFASSGSITVTGDIISTGTITAQTLNVQVITSSVEFVTGSTHFGSVITNTHQFTGSVGISGSLVMNGASSITGSLLGTASRADNATSASYAANATTASYALNTTSASYAANATSASYAVQATSAVYAQLANTASYAIIALSGTGSFTGSFSGSFTGSLLGTASRADNATSASYAANATSASYALNTTSASYASVATSASYASASTSASYAQQTTTASYALVATSASYASASTSASYASASTSASYAQQATTASFANNADLLDGLNSTVFATTGSNTFRGNQTVTGSLFTSGSNTLIGSTTLTGSFVISGSEIVTGYIQFLPVSTNVDSTVSASYIYVSGSTNDLYFTQNGQGYSNTTRLRWLESNLYTGLLSGGVLSSTPGSTTFNLSSGSGIIVQLNASTGSVDPFPTVQKVSWNNFTNVPITNSGSAKITYISVTSAGTINQQIVPIGSTDVTQYDTQIEIGVVLHLSSSVSTGVYNSPQVSYGFAQRTDDFVRAFGPLKVSGHTLQPSGSTLGLIKTAGVSYNNGSNYVNNPSHPSTVSDPAITTSKIYRYYISGSTPVIDLDGPSGYTFIDPTKYVNTTTGTLDNVPGGSYSIQRVFWVPNSPTNAFIVYYGNATYNSADSAVAAIQTEPFTEAPNTAQNAILLGYIIVNGNETNLQNATFIQGGLFRSINGIGNSNTSPVSNTLAGLSDVSIASRATGDLLYYNGSQWVNSKQLSGSFGFTGSLGILGTISASAFTGSLFGTASWANNATSASYALNATTSSYALVATSASFASASTSASFASNAAQASTASYVVLAQTASFVTTAQTASYVVLAQTASFVTTAQTASYVVLAQTASFVTTAQTASYVATASYANNADLLDGLNSSVFATTGSNIFNGTQTITGSILQSGSFTSTGTITAQTLIIQTITSSVDFVTGSTRFGSLSSNTHVFTGSVSISGSLNTNGPITGSSFTGSFTGSFLGTASRADNATSASYAANATTSSYSLVATSASYSLTSTTASYANNADLLDGLDSTVFATTGSNIFKGNQTISGSIYQTGSDVFFGGNVGVGVSSVYTPSQFSLDVNGGLLVKNLNKTASITLINADPSVGGNNAFVIHSVGGTFGTSYARIQGYYGTSITGSTLLQLNPFGGNVGINTLTASLATLQVGGNVYATSFTGSFSGTSSYATNALTASYAMNGGGSGLSALYIQDEGVTQGTASYINFTGTGVTATVTAGTASISITGGGGSATGQSVLFTQASPATTWSFSHNLNNQYVTYNVYDSNSNAIIPANVSASSANTLLITFGVATAGYAVATVGGGLPYISGSYGGYVLTVSGSVATWTPTSSISVATASYALNATTSSYALIATSASYASASTSASYASSSTSASFASNAAQAQTASYVVTAQTASFVTLAQTASFVATASYALNADLLDGVHLSTLATTGSNTFNGTQTITGSILQSGSFTSTGTITAQTLVVQTVTSSTVYSSGSNIFGNSLANTQTFTGSILATGSSHVIYGNVGLGEPSPSDMLVVNGRARINGTNRLAFGNSAGGYAQIGVSGATTGNLIFLNFNGSTTNENMRITLDGNVGIGTTSPNARLDVSGSARLNGNAIITGSLTVITGSAIEFQVTNTGVKIGNATTDTHTVTGSLNISGSTTSTSFTGSLFGTASYASNTLTASYSLVATSASYANNATTSSYALTTTSASYALTATSASYVNTLNQNVIVTGSLTVGATSVGANENTLILGPAPAGGAGEGGQLLLQAAGGTYTSASMWDNWQNQTRLLRGTNAGSDAMIASFNMHTKQVQFPAYTGSGAFPGTATANLSVDSGGNIITTAIGSSLTGGSTNYIARWASSTTLTTGSLFDNGTNVGIGSISPAYKLDVSGDIRATGAVYANANNQMYFRGGDDAELWDINVANTIGVYGLQDQTVASIKLGSGGGTISGYSGNIGIGTTTASLGKLHVNGNVYATSFTGSFTGSLVGALTGTSSFATSASYALTATSASYAATSTSGSYAATASVASTTFGIGATIQTYGSVASSIVGSNNLFSQNTGSYTSAFFKYTATSGSNTRAGEVISAWNGTTTTYTDFSTVDIGNTNNVTASISIVTGQVQFNVQTNSSGWAIKSIATFM